ncbi:hypothetical protein FGIG_03909 [Fasciola gigantica]|uniref:Uncharacterized protein n=1 Tax=Fasciola gigantica TaxID=46835 RepID=A0A504YZI2_FASGI|nr:hypothetical protein FGIG_03909 [Fasciola gigantica]
MSVRSLLKTDCSPNKNKGCSAAKGCLNSTQCTDSISVREWTTRKDTNMHTRKKSPSYSGQSESKSPGKLLTRQSTVPLVRPHRPRNNSAAPMHRYVQRRPTDRLPPLDFTRRTGISDSIENSSVSHDSHAGATCPTDYFKRVRQKIYSHSAVIGTNTKDHSIDSVGKETSKSTKLKPIAVQKKQTQAPEENTSHIANNDTRSITSNQSSSIHAAESSKRKVSNFNMKNTTGDVTTPGSSTTINTLTKEDQISSGTMPNRSTEPVATEGERSNSESLKHTVRSKIADELEEIGSRDRYLSVMEEMLKKHKGLSTRTPRNLNGIGGNSASVVPSRRIQPLTVIPEDPMMRFTGRHVYHSMGFKIPEKSESLMVEPDHEQIHQASLLQECEALFEDRVPTKVSHQTHSFAHLDHLQTTEATARDKMGSVIKTTRTEENSTWDESSLEPLDSESDSLGSNSDEENDKATERKTSQSGQNRTERHRTPQIDVNRIYFYFNPVVQIYPNQTPWRIRSTISGSTEYHPNTEEGNIKNAQKERKQDERFLASLELVDRGLPTRRSTTAAPTLERSLSTDRLLEMRQAMRSVRVTRSSSSSLSDLQTPSSLSESTDWNEQRIRLVRSASDGLMGISFHETVRPSAPIRLDLVNPGKLGVSVTDRTIIAQDGLHRTRGSLSIHEIATSSFENLDKPLHTNGVDGKKGDTIDGSADYISQQEYDDKVGNGGGTADAERGRIDAKNEALEADTRVSSKIPNISQCEDAFTASVDPNPMAWFDILEDRLENCTQRLTFREKLIAQFRLKGLQKRFVAIPHGIYGLQRVLEKGWDIRPKPELLMSCVVKHHMLKMPLNTPNPNLVEKIYTNSIVRYPVLYKLIMRRREILPQEMQHFLNRIMELTETSDRMLASISSSTTKLSALTTAAKEQDASGFMTGGPKQNFRDSRSSLTSSSRARASRSSLINRTGLTVAQDSDTIFSDIPDIMSMTNQAKKDGGFCTTYAKETDFDKGFYTVLRNPCTNILEEVALLNPEFAWHVRPLFEHRWATLEEDLLEQMFIQKKQTSSCITKAERCEPSNTVLAQPTSSNKTSRCGRFSQWPEALDYCKNLLSQVFDAITDSVTQKPGSRVYTDLLICLHMTNYYTELGDLLVKELDLWVPPLLSGLENSYSSVREDTCCILAYLVCSYRLITRLHVVSKNLLVANICFAVLSAIGHYPESYAFYHGLLGYILHAVPCLSALDCLLLWLPSVQNNETNLVSRDWSLYVYYVFRHWPRNPFYVDAMYQKKLLRPLEASYLTKHAKRAARLALSYLVRTCHVRSALLICWPETEGEATAE